jgi:hypothetical protein
MSSIHEKLVTIQSSLVAPKNQYYSFGKYKYRSCEDILKGVKPLLASESLVLVLDDEIVAVGDRIYVKATATITDGEADISATGWAREADSKKGMDSAQVTGSTSSYARKYALNGLLCIDDTKDADALNNGKNTPPEAENAPPVSEAQLKKLHAVAGQLKIERDALLKGCAAHIGRVIQSTKDLTKAEAVKVIDAMERKAQGAA